METMIIIGVVALIAFIIGTMATGRQPNAGPTIIVAPPVDPFYSGVGDALLGLGIFGSIVLFFILGGLS